MFIKFILAAIVVVVAIAGIAYYNKTENNNEKPQLEFITEKDAKLTADERKIAEDRLADIRKKLEEIKDATDQEKYSLTMQLGFQKNVLGKIAEARDAFLAAEKMQPENYTAPLALFHAYLAMGDNDSALASIKKAIDLRSENAELWRQYIMLEKERFSATNEKLQEIYSEALAKTNSSVDIITVYAQFLEEKGDLNKAIEQWQKAIAAYPREEALYQGEITRLEGLIK
ncbi:hypothetical protein KJ854_00730 [Patescibacteria group bacterium]|nr:hypothetical protein [Patescibacteria group bacterium]